MKLRELIKMEKKLQKIYLTYQNLLIAQDLWQAHYQILSIIFLKEFIKVNVHTDTMVRNVKLAECRIDQCRTKDKYCDCFLEYTNVTGGLIE